MLNNLKKKQFLCILLFIFVLIKIFLFLKINNTQGIAYTWQVLDLKILQNDLIKSIFYLHSQPPLWNLFIGLMLKIFNGDTKFFYLFLYLYHQCLTIIIIYVFVSLAKETNKKIIFLLVLFLIILNPAIIYFEALNYYAHTIFFLSCIFVYNFYLFLINKKNKYLCFCYIILTLKILIWSAYHPIIMIIFFLFLQCFCIESRNLKNFIVFFLLCIFAFLPGVKNKIIYQNNFNSFLGFSLASTVNGLIDLPECAMGPIPHQSKKYEDLAISKINNKYNLNFKHPSIYGIQSKKNSIAMIYLSEHCTKKVLDFIVRNPLIYVKRIVTEIVATHGQFIIDLGNYIDQPTGWNFIQKITLEIDKNNFLKIIRQITNFLFMIFIYIYFIFFLLKKNNNILDKKLISILLINYFYILSVGIFISKYEAVRFIYSEYILIMLFFLYNFTKNRSLFKNI